MPDELQEGASFSDILETPETDAQATPTEETTEVAAATDGGTTEPETLGILKEEEKAPEGEDKPDLSLDPDLEKHPILKAKWEAYKAQKEKGIDQFITENQNKLKEAEDFRTENQEVIEFANSFKDPEQVDETFEALCKTLARGYGRPFGGFKPDGTKLESSEATVAGESKYGFEYAEDDKIVETTVRLIIPQIKAILDERLGPVENDRKAKTEAEQATAKAAEALPVLKSTFEVSAEPWVTQELVSEAMKAYPSLDPQAAFAAHFVKRIAAYSVKHAGGQQVRNLPQNNSGGVARSELKPGASMMDIFASEVTL